MPETYCKAEQRWEHVRARYPDQEPLLNLNNAAVSPPPKVVEQATIDALRFISRNPDVNMWSALDTQLPATKQALAELVDGDPAEICISSRRRRIEPESRARALTAPIPFASTLSATDPPVMSGQ
jgi:selenocysteine lyase/cysteine desulfurase